MECKSPDGYDCIRQGASLRGDFGEGLEAEGTPLSLQEGATSMLVSRFF